MIDTRSKTNQQIENDPEDMLVSLRDYGLPKAQQIENDHEDMLVSLRDYGLPKALKLSPKNSRAN